MRPNCTTWLQLWRQAGASLRHMPCKLTKPNHTCMFSEILLWGSKCEKRFLKRPFYKKFTWKRGWLCWCYCASGLNSNKPGGQKKNGSRELTNSLLLSTLLPSKIYAASFCPEVVDKIVCSRQEKQWSFWVSVWYP
jgi:hypothetical protein